MKNKAIILTAALISAAVNSFSQVRSYAADPYNEYSIGINAGYTTMMGDLSHSDPSPALILSLAKHIAPAVTIGVELQRGILSSNEPQNNWTTGLKEKNQFTAFNVNGKASLGYLITEPKNMLMKVLSNLYVGVGAGMINNDITNITDKFKTTDSKTIDQDITKSSLALVIPANIGISFYMKRFLGYKGVQFNANYQVIKSFSDNIDGYNFPSSTSHNDHYDGYSILSVGLAFYLGHMDDEKK